MLEVITWAKFIPIALAVGNTIPFSNFLVFGGP